MAVKGRLGNQLFQWAAAKGLQSDPDAPAVLDNRLRRRFGEPLIAALRPGELRNVTQLELLKLRQMPRLPWYFQDAGFRGAAHSDRLVALSESYSWRERGIGYDVNAQANLDKLLLGFFQDVRYFEHIADRVQRGFRPPSKEASRSMREIRQQLLGHSTVAITVRSGADYNQLNWTLPLDFYLKAAALAAEHLGNPGFVVTGDVSSHAQRLSDALSNIGPSITAARLPGLDQLHVVADQDHVVVSNSTFAWWCAWLGDQRQNSSGRVVIAPATWLPAHPHPAPVQWTRLPATLGNGWQS